MNFGFQLKLKEWLSRGVPARIIIISISILIIRVSPKNSIILVYRSVISVAHWLGFSGGVLVLGMLVPGHPLPSTF